MNAGCLPLFIALVILSCPIAGLGAVTAEQARQLGANLTRVGAERAGNADGSIPAYTGQLVQAPPSYKPGSGRYPSPFADEKPVLRIDSSNVARYADQLTPGIVATLRQYPSFHLNVYPSHRTAVYPDWVLDNTLKNATQAELSGDVPGDAVKNAYGGIPFPIPRNGDEVIWNFRLRYLPASRDQRHVNYLVDAAGRRTFLSRHNCLFANAYYDPAARSLNDPYFFRQFCIGEAPASQAGYNILFTNSADYGKYDQVTWVYTPGQRRVRIAPEFSYDTPVANYSGALTYDEINVFSGRADRFNLKLVGKKEMYIPYNNNGLFAPDAVEENYLTAKHPNPDFLRWEKHRVWVVEGTLKQGKRHILSRRTFFVDEDTWHIVATDGYDHAGKLYRVGLALPFLVYEDKQGAPYVSSQVYMYLDLSKGEYYTPLPSASGRYVAQEKLPDMGLFTSSRLAATGVR